MAIKLNPIDDSLILDKMRYENPWWVTSEIEDEFKTMRERLYFELFFPLVIEMDVKRAVVLMGPRRVGKTVMMHHAIQKLLYYKAAKRNEICFINIENPLYLNMGLEELFKLAMAASANNNPKGWFVFFDEIQYLKDWERHLKTLVDSYPHTKFVVSGSAAAALKLKSVESGAGRFTDFMLPPLTFDEYIHLMRFDHLIFPDEFTWGNVKSKYFRTNNITQFNKHFIDYINFGGYPEVIFSEKIKSNPSRYIKSDIVDKVLLRDLPSLYGIQNVQELNAFFTMLAYYTGNEVSLDTLSQKSGVNKPTLVKYISYLEAAFLIKQIYRVDEAGKKFKRQNYYKIYLTNTSLRSALFSPISATDDAFGSLVETAVFSQWLHRDWFIPYYARWASGEVDMVGIDDSKLKPTWAVEIKWSNKFFDYPDNLKSLHFFCEKNNLKNAVVTTIDKEGVGATDSLVINYTPSSVYAYNVGYKTIEQKRTL